MSVTKGRRFRFLIEAPEDSEALRALEEKLSARGCLHKRRAVPRSNVVRLLVAKVHHDIALRLMLEWAATAGTFSGVEGSMPKPKGSGVAGSTVIH